MKKIQVLMVLVMSVLLLFGSVYAEEMADPICINCNIPVASKYCPDCGEEVALQKPLLKDGEGYLTLEITYEKNVVLAKYDVIVTVDGEQIATIKQGEFFTRTVVLKQGLHTIKVSAEDGSPSATDMVDVWTDTSFSCTLKAHFSSIEMKQVETNGFVSDEREEAFMAEQFRVSCREVGHEDCSRYPSRYTLYPTRVTGTVIDLVDGLLGGMTLVVQDAQDHLWLIQYNKSVTEPRILVGDNITVYGLGGGLKSCETAIKTYASLPMVVLECYDNN